MTKGIIALLMVALLSLGVAIAEDSYYLELPSKGIQATKKITVAVPDENPVIDGINPLTGENWFGNYYPILVNIDTHPKALPHWGVSSADIIYELPLQRDGSTRSVALFMGQIPNYAGPVRSARAPLASIREMWDSAWCFYGWQNAAKKNDLVVDVDNWVLHLHDDARQKGRWVFPFIEGIERNYASFFHREKDGVHVAPYNVQVDLTEVVKLFNQESTKHPFLFTDTGLERGIDVPHIVIEHKTTDPAYVTEYQFNEETGLYDRYRNGSEYIDANTGMATSFANVIVIRTNVSWHNNNAARPVVQLIGQGTAEIFQNGKYIRGTWVRTHNAKTADDFDSQSARMVFLDENGEELPMKVGKTFIQVVDNEQPVLVTSYEKIDGAKAQATPEPTPTPKPTRVPPPTRTPRAASAATPEPMMDMEEEGDEDFSFGA